MFQSVRDVKRLREILAVIFKHGFGYFFHRDSLQEIPGFRFMAPKILSETAQEPPAVRFRRVIEELGPTYVKIGQMLSTRAELVPKDFIDELQKLQSQVPAMSDKEVQACLSEYLGASFSSEAIQIDPNPIASGSIAQVHVARARIDGVEQELVCKIKRLDIEKVINSDLSILRVLVRILESSFEEIHFYSPSEILRQLEITLRAELDFKTEIANLEKVGASFQGRRLAPELPRAVEHLSTRNLLVMTRISGQPLEASQLSASQRQRLLEQMLDVIYHMVFVDGFFMPTPTLEISFIPKRVNSE